MGGPLRYAYIDESGSVSPFTGSRFLVVALISMAQPRPVELHVKRAHKRYGASLASGEMKADASRGVVVEQLLKSLACEPIAIIAAVVDKRAIRRPPQDPEEIYRRTVSLVIQQAIRRWPRIEICLDRRYTTRRLRDRLERDIREATAGVHQEVVIIRQEDSLTCKLLQATDFVTWAIFEKYERGDGHFYDLITGRILVEKHIRRSLW